MKDKTDADLIEEAERPLITFCAGERPDLVEVIVASRRLAIELASRLKAANELLDERLKQVAVLHVELRAASEMLEIVTFDRNEAWKRLGIPE